MRKSSPKEKEQLILHLIKSCENFNLTEKETLDSINKVFGKDISRRTYYTYKKKLYDKDIIHQLKDSIYDNHMMRCLLLDLEETEWQKSLEADKLIAEQFPDRKDLFHDTERQKEELEELEEMKSRLELFGKPLNEPLRRYEEVPKNANIKEEFIKCGKENCNDCPHGPYFYAYWKDTTTKKLKKKYIGQFNPRK